MKRTGPIIFLALLVSAPALAQPDEAPDEDTSKSDKGAEADAKGATDEAAAPEQETVDLDALRKEYRRLRDQLFRSRARVNTVGSALYTTRMRVHLDYTSGRFYTVTRAAIRLDGASVFEDVDGVIARDRAPRFEGYVTPGRHVVNIRIEATGKDDPRFHSIIDDTFTVEIPDDGDFVIKAKAKDGGDIPYRWSRKKHGTYKLHLDVKVAAVKKLKQPKKKGKKGK